YGMEPRVAAVEEGRVRRQREQRRQEPPQVVADGDGPIDAPYPHVDVEAPGVVALRHPSELLPQARVVRRLDDALVEVVGPRMSAGRREAKSHPLREGEQPCPALALALRSLG